MVGTPNKISPMALWERLKKSRDYKTMESRARFSKTWNDANWLKKQPGYKAYKASRTPNRKRAKHTVAAFLRSSSGGKTAVTVNRKYKPGKAQKFFDQPDQPTHSRSYTIGERQVTGVNTVTFQPFGAALTAIFNVPFGLGSAFFPDKVWAEKVAGGSSPDDDVKMLWIKSERITHFLQNQTNSPCYLKIHEVVMKNDHFGTAIEKFPDYVMRKGFQDVGLAYSQAQSLGVTLAQNPIFRKMCKIVKTTSKELGGGEKIQYSMFKKHNRYWSYKYRGDRNFIDNYFIPRGTKFLLIECQGGVCHDITTVGNIGTTGCVIDILCKYKVFYKLKPVIAAGENEVHYASFITTAPATVETVVDTDINVEAPDS